MPSYKTHGIIINRHNLGEADRILTILTQDHGTIRAVAKGLRRIKSKLAGHLELFCEAELMLHTGKNLDIVTSARLVTYHPALTSDYDRLRLAYLFAEMLDKLGGERERHPGLYELAQEAFRQLQREPADELVELWFRLRLLGDLGYRPELAACVVCGVRDGERRYLFSAELGGIVDVRCSGPGALTMTHDAIKLWRLLLEHRLDDVRRVEGVVGAAPEALIISHAFYDYTFGRRFRSSEILA